MNKIFETINDSKKILVLTHESPDGDAVGSSMAFYQLLKGMKKDVTVVIPEIPETFLFMKDIDKVLTQSGEEYDLAIVVDCSTKDRIGQLNNEFSRCKKSIIIDHHMSNENYGDINYVEGDTSSCAQVVYFLLKYNDIVISKDVAEGLAVGMLTDTSGFRNNDTDKNTFIMAANLVDLGVDVHHIYYLVLSKKSMAQYLLMKMTLDRLELLNDGKIAFSYISEEDMANVGAKMGDHEGLVDLGRNVAGVEVSVFMRESEGCYRISLRSNGQINVNDVASKFGGGGHKMAAGIKISGDFKETKERVINAIKEEFNA